MYNSTRLHVERITSSALGNCSRNFCVAATVCAGLNANVSRSDSGAVRWFRPTTNSRSDCGRGEDVVDSREIGQLHLAATNAPIKRTNPATDSHAARRPRKAGLNG